MLAPPPPLSLLQALSWGGEGRGVFCICIMGKGSREILINIVKGDNSEDPTELHLSSGKGVGSSSFQSNSVAYPSKLQEIHLSNHSTVVLNSWQHSLLTLHSFTLLLHWAHELTTPASLQLYSYDLIWAAFVFRFGHTHSLAQLPTILHSRLALTSCS